MFNYIKKQFVALVLLLVPSFGWGVGVLTTKVLPNGLKVVLYERPGSQFSAVKMCYNFGEKNEIDSSGMSRLLAQMMSGKTMKPKDISFTEKIKKLGGFTFADVDQDKTVFTTQVPSKNLEKVFEAEANRMVDLALTDEWISYSYNQVRLQQAITEGDWHAQFSASRKALMYPANYPYRYNKITKKATENECFSQYRNYYHPYNTVLVVVTSSKAATVIPMIERQLGAVNKRGKLGATDKLMTLNWPVEILKNLNPRTSSAVLSFIVNQPNATDSDYYPYKVLKQLLLGPMGILSTHPGVTDVYVNDDTETLYPTYHTIDLVAAIDDKDKVLKSIDEVFGKYLYKGFPEEKVVAVKTYLMALPVMQYKEDNKSIAQHLLEGMYYHNDAEYLMKLEKGYEQVTVEQVGKCLRKYFLADKVRSFVY